MAAAFALATLAVGVGITYLAMAAHVWTTGDLSPSYVTSEPVPLWLSLAVRLVLYPLQGIALWHLWQSHRAHDVRPPLVWFGAAFLANAPVWLAFAPIASLTVDALGPTLVAITFVTSRRCSRAAARWLLPWLTWTSLATLLKWWGLVAHL